MPALSRTLLCVLLLLPGMAMAQTGAIKIADAWVRAAPPTVSMHAAYAALQNTGDKAVTLVKVTSPQFGHIMLHESFVENGMAKMRHVAELTLQPNETVKLTPGGYHLMLMQAKSAIKTGEHIRFVFYFSNGETVAVTAPVKRAGTQHGGHQAHHHGD